MYTVIEMFQEERGQMEFVLRTRGFVKGVRRILRENETSEDFHLKKILGR